MWARVIEVMLAFWLAISSFIFQNHSFVFRKNDLICSAFVLFFSLSSFSERFGKLHLANIGVAFWLIGMAFHFKPAPILENYLTLALLFLILALIPSHAELPPRPWREFYKKRK